jgi:hypothetical protein
VPEKGISLPSGEYWRGWADAHSPRVGIWVDSAHEGAGYPPQTVTKQIAIAMNTVDFNRFAHLRAFA